MRKTFVIAFLTLFLSACMMWVYLDRERTKQINSLLDVKASSLHQRLEEDISARVHTLERIASRWSMQQGTPQEQFEYDVSNILRDLPGFQAIEWVDSLGYVRWVVPLEGNEQALGLNLAAEPKRKAALEQAKIKQGATITAPLELVQSGAGFLVYFPIFIADRFDGFVLGVMRYDTWLEHIFLVDHNLYHVDFIVNQQLLVTLGGEASNSYPSVSFTKNIFDWEVEIRLSPTPFFVESNSNYFPEYATATYFILSLLLLCGIQLILHLTKIRNTLKLSEENSSQLVRTLQEFKDIVDEVQDCVFIFDAKSLLFTYTNRGAELQVGYSASELSQMHPFDIKPNFDEPSFRRLIKPLVDKELPFLNFETTHQHKDGHLLDVNINLQLVEQGDGKIRFVAIVRDISEWKSKELQLRQSHKLEAIGRLAGGIAHDFNNQLSVILGCTEIISRAKTQEQANKFVEKIAMAANASSRLTKQLLTFSRKDDINVESINIHQLIIDLLDVSSRTLEKKVRIESRLNARKCEVLADSSQIYNALFNIIINAKDAMPTGGQLTISTNNIGHENELIEITVIDTGEGISPENQLMVFEPFFTTKSMGQGTGLGLASVKGAIEQSNGTIELKSELGVGTSIKITLPLCSDGITSQPQNDSQIEARVAPYHKKIIVVDDEPLVGDVLCEFLKILGCEPIYFAGGNAAIEMLKRENCDIELVITDMLMPEMDGMELLKTVKTINSEIDVIVVSGYMADNKKAEVISAGASCVLQKPVNLEELKTQLERY